MYITFVLRSPIRRARPFENATHLFLRLGTSQPPKRRHRSAAWSATGTSLCAAMPTFRRNTSLARVCFPPIVVEIPMMDHGLYGLFAVPERRG